MNYEINGGDTQPKLTKWSEKVLFAKLSQEVFISNTEDKSNSIILPNCTAAQGLENGIVHVNFSSIVQPQNCVNMVYYQKQQRKFEFNFSNKNVIWRKFGFSPGIPFKGPSQFTYNQSKKKNETIKSIK